ncbi:MAG: HlyD family secretion protein, partial [Spirochaetaceae bacterium]
MTNKAVYQRLFLLSLFIISACSGEYSKGTPPREDSGGFPSLELVRALPGVYAPYTDAPGTFVTSKKITVSSPFSAELAGFPVRAGSCVEKGEIIVELDTDFLERELLRLQNRLEIKRQELKTREYALEEAVQEAERRWSSARRILLELQQAEKSLMEALSAAADDRELYEAGGVSRSTVKESEKRVEQGEHEIERLALLLEEAVAGFNIQEFNTPEINPKKIDPQVLEEHQSIEGLKSLEKIFTEEEKMSLILETAKKNTTFIHIAEAEVEEVENTIQSVKDKIESAAVRAPISGVVESVYVQRGEFVETGHPMCVLYDPDTLLIEAVLGESAAGKIVSGGKAELL